MKEILIMRHAKSDWSTGEADFKRPLNARGKADAPFMGKTLKEKQLTPGQILASPARRAKMTAEAVSQNCGYEGEIRWVEDFYYSDEKFMLEILQNLPESVSRVLIIAHNPTLESLVALLAAEFVSMPTASVVSVHAPIQKWNELTPYECDMNWIITPKGLKK